MTRPARLALVVSILSLALRFIWIDQPYVDKWSWRQSDVAAIARNYFRGGFHFARPQIDWAGDQPGYVGTEFPILPFIAAASYKVFGVHEWVGRSQSVLLFGLSVPFFFLLSRKIFGELAALWALFFYSFAPLGIMASRCFMPDMPSLALSIVGLYLFLIWIENESRVAWLASAICISLSILVKATAVVILGPIAALIVAAIYDRQNPEEVGSRRAPLQLLLFAPIALVPSAIWYWHAYQISRQFYPFHFFGAGGVQIMALAWYLGIASLLVSSTLTPILFFLGAAGIALALRQPRARPFYWWLGAMILFTIAVGYGNRHQWYQLPFVPIFAVFAGAASSFVAARIPSRPGQLSLSVIVAVCFLLVSGLHLRAFYQPDAAPLRDAGLAIKAVTPADALIVAADNGDPTLLYYAERKGWHFLEKQGIYDGNPLDSAQAIADLHALKNRGATYLVFTSNTAWWLDYYRQFGEDVVANSTIVRATPEFRIYKLTPR